MNEIEKIIEKELERYARENWEFNEVLRKEVPFDVEDCKWCDLVAFARHFYDIGCIRTAEKYDEIEHNRQRSEQDVIDIIQSRISEIIGDAQPKPTLRAELQELINKINNHE